MDAQKHSDWIADAVEAYQTSHPVPLPVGRGGRRQPMEVNPSPAILIPPTAPSPAVTIHPTALSPDVAIPPTIPPSPAVTIPTPSHSKPIDSMSMGSSSSSSTNAIIDL
jgi:hypothetical protein